MANTYGKAALTGGASDALDGIDGSGLNDLDRSIVMIQGTGVYFYILDDDSGAAESSPDVISPDNNAGTKRWILHNFVGTSTYVVTNGAPVANDIARFTDADTIEGRSYTELKGDLNLEIGTDVLAQQTIGIANDNLLEVDQADAANGEYTRMTANGIESRSKLETQADLCVPIDASNTDVDTGTETVDSFADTTGDVCFWFVKVKKGANVRAQIFMANWDASGDTIEYSQGQTTLDVGDTSDLVLSADIDSNNIRLRATAGSDDWEVTVKRMVV